MIGRLKRKLRHLALLDAVLEQEWQYRYFSYDAQWSDLEEMASLRNGSGGEWFLHFHGDNVAFKCTSPADGLVDNFDALKSSVPPRYSSFLDEPAFSLHQGSAIWYLEEDSWIKLGKPINDLPDPEDVLAMSAFDYCQYAEGYFECSVNQALVQAVFDGDFHIDVARQLNLDVDMELLANDLRQIGKLS